MWRSWQHVLSHDCTCVIVLHALRCTAVNTQFKEVAKLQSFLSGWPSILTNQP